jgi:dinuclear metal center YbgI/SA1388 family protein
MGIQGRELIRAMEAWAPPRLAVEKDRIGLQVGNPDAEIRGVLVTLDVTEDVVDEAIRLGANWIVAHHAVIYKPVSSLRTDRPAGRLYQKLLQHQIQVYIAHTNLDTADDGVNDVLAERLGLQETEVLLPHIHERLKKIVVFVPEDHHEAVLNAMCAAGAGWIGQYSHCTFNVNGTGTFLPREGTNPYIGEQGKLERVKEIRLETIITESIQSRVIRAMLDAHPYEEVAYDLYPLDNPGPAMGLGRVGNLPQPVTLRQLAEQVKSAYEIDGVRFVGDPDRQVRRVAIMGGSGGRFYSAALDQQADVYITGDIDFHTAQDALADGLCLIDPGHHVERWVVPRVCEKLRAALPDVTITPSKVDTNPFRFA